MKIMKISDVQVEEHSGGLFTGKVQRRWLVDEKISQALRVMVVSFSPGARTKLHTHTFDHLLFVTEGKGIVGTEKEKQVVVPGMVAFFPAGELHLHGATDDSSFSHIAISTPGKTDF